MSSSTGSPMSSFLLMPSNPAERIAARQRYGFAAVSGVRYSRRFLDEYLGPFMFTGMRMLADLFRRLHAMYTGASNPGTSLRYEFVVGFVIAARARACSINPPPKYRPSWLNSA